MEKAAGNNNNGAQTSNSVNPQQGLNVEATYMECRRNYTAAIGDYVVEGCRKFVRCGGQDETKVETIVCATCGCHRNFHRKVPNSPHLPPVDPTCHNFNMKDQYCYIRPVTITGTSRPPTTWMMRTVTPSVVLPNHELIEGQGSCKSPTEFAEETSQSDDGEEEEVNSPEITN